MSQQENIRIAQELLAGMGEGRDPAVIADGHLDCGRSRRRSADRGPGRP